MRRSRFIVFPLALGGLLVAAVPAFAHAHLDHAVPAVSGKVAEAPAQLELFFTEGVVPHFCRIELLDPHGKQVKTGAPETAKANSERAARRPAEARGRHLHRRLARHLRGLAQDEGQLQVHGGALSGQGAPSVPAG